MISLWRDLRRAAKSAASSLSSWRYRSSRVPEPAGLLSVLRASHSIWAFSTSSWSAKKLSPKRLFIALTANSCPSSHFARSLEVDSWVSTSLIIGWLGRARTTGATAWSTLQYLKKASRCQVLTHFSGPGALPVLRASWCGAVGRWSYPWWRCFLPTLLFARASVGSRGLIWIEWLWVNGSTKKIVAVRGFEGWFSSGVTWGRGTVGEVLRHVVTTVSIEPLAFMLPGSLVKCSVIPWKVTLKDAATSTSFVPLLPELFSGGVWGKDGWPMCSYLARSRRGACRWWAWSAGRRGRIA